MNSKAIAGYKGIQNTLCRLSQMQPDKLDKLIAHLHSDEFKNINCLECANCCRTISPAMTDSDVRRMAGHVKMNSQMCVREYLYLDNDGDYMFNITPCPFFGSNNYCSIYESRPQACKEYPHTNRKQYYQILDITARNSKVCPVVYNIMA
jgi:Fe-S-cluster containining protein